MIDHILIKSVSIDKVGNRFKLSWKILSPYDSNGKKRSYPIVNKSVVLNSENECSIYLSKLLSRYPLGVNIYIDGVLVPESVI